MATTLVRLLLLEPGMDFGLVGQPAASAGATKAVAI
jgi:hypothetical protein